MKYNHKEIEKKWQKYWNDNKTFKVKEDKNKEKFYVLDMFPYPSGDGLHVGHPKGYVATDVYARYMMLNGKNVLHPMGFDSFGLPAENYAIKNKVHPQVAVDKNIKRFKKQLEQFGFTYDWDREVVTSDPDYYKWTQWIFLKMFENGLAYESTEPINWCPSCKTGLANEDLENGKCERCGSQVEKKPMRQWVLKMTDYAERLLDDLKLVDWEKSIVDQQINWIGKSNGSEIDFVLDTSKEKLRVFTTRADTLFGATYMVISPEHPILEKIEKQIKNIDDIRKYQKKAREKSDLERTDLAKEKTGVKISGVMAINPANNSKIPVYVADYVLSNYGTGAIMAVPAHDERDFEFAKKFDIKIIEVIRPSTKNELPYSGHGVLVNSGKFDGMESEEAKKEITHFVGGRETVNYKMHDWVFSRQRYWGEPIPLVHCEQCGIVPVSEKDLPIKLPNVKNYKPTGTGESPLANIKDWVETKCSKCGGSAKRETNTMPQWAGSCWYYLRYINPKNKHVLVEKDDEKYWMEPNGIDLYVGGAEHATRHLLYARFWHKFLYDINIVSTKEPFYRLQHVGLIRGSDGRKMSKRWGNVVNPDDVINEYGADALRMYEMFMGPFADSVAWSTDGVKGTKRFLDRIWKLYNSIIDCKSNLVEIKSKEIGNLVEKISNDIEKFNFNTAISALMIYFNNRDFAPRISNETKTLSDCRVDLNAMKDFLILLSPFAPHIAEDLWNKLGQKESIFEAQWPKAIKIKNVTDLKIPVMINGKKRALLIVKNDGTTKNLLQKLALADENVKKHIGDKNIKKVIYIPGKIISFVI